MRPTTGEIVVVTVRSVMRGMAVGTAWRRGRSGVEGRASELLYAIGLSLGFY